ncbi:MAG: YIP1 family protein [Archangium sp.]|nr:YIP1 family protein [Archangium sp.]MDP3575715.1 YIP1 family protein [Archangium sp.]
MVIYLGMALAFTMGSVFLVSGIEHLALRMLGAEPKSFTVTVRAYALGMSAYLLGVIPFCSFYVFPVWAIVLRIIAVMHLHKTTAGKASAAVLLPVLVLCGGFIGLYVAVIALAMSIGH